MKFLLYIVGAVVAGIILTLVLLSLGGDPAENIFSGKKLGPEAKKAAEISASIGDHHQAGTMLDNVVAKPVACGTAARNAFDPFSGKNRFWFYRWPEGTIECYNTGGFHRITGEELQPLGVAQIQVILADQEKYQSDADLWGPPARRSRPSAAAQATQAPVQAPTIIKIVEPTPQHPSTAPPPKPCGCDDDEATWSTPTRPEREQ